MGENLQEAAEGGVYLKNGKVEPRDIVLIFEVQSWLTGL